MKIKPFIFGAILACILPACTSKRTDLTYFKDIDSLKPAVTINVADYETVIRPDDELFITVNSTSNPLVTTIYNLPQANPAQVKDGATTQTQIQNQTYVVNSAGDIDFPEIGTIHVAGMTPEQLKALLTKEISKTVKNPIVMVRLLNFTIDVAGEVKNPGTFNINRQRFSILDAISTAGDLTEYGERSNILLIREEDGKRVHHRLDLTSAELLSSPYFYVRQNDYIYVEPNSIRQDNSKYNQNNAFKLSVVTTIVSGVSVIASLVIALAIK